MPNNPATRMAGAVQVTAANQIVRRGEQAITIEAKLAASSAQSATGSGSPTTDTTIPAGIIAMWGGLLVDIPAGWLLCDGTSGTPDLRARFIKGSAAGVDPGVTGGATFHVPAGSVSAPSVTTQPAVSAAGVSFVTAVGTPTFTGSSASYEPLYYSLAFIQKTA